MLLEVRALTKYFGGLVAVWELDMYVNEGEITGLIGPNGAGKTTVFNLITGFIRPTAGKVLFSGKDITRIKPHKIARRGIGRTFQLVPLFADFTVMQNVVASFYLHPKSSLWATFFNTGTYRSNEKYILEQSLEILEVVGLSQVKDQLAKNLPHGYQKMLGIARALAVRPKLLLLDEPMAGMSSDEISFTVKAIQKMRKQGLTILMVEHNVGVMDLCDRVVVMNFGQKIAEGSIKDVRQNTEVIKAYFGSTHAT